MIIVSKDPSKHSGVPCILDSTTEFVKTGKRTLSASASGLSLRHLDGWVIPTPYLRPVYNVVSDVLTVDRGIILVSGKDKAIPPYEWVLTRVGDISDSQGGWVGNVLRFEPAETRTFLPEDSPRIPWQGLPIIHRDWVLDVSIYYPALRTAIVKIKDEISDRDIYAHTMDELVILAHNWKTTSTHRFDL